MIASDGSDALHAGRAFGLLGSSDSDNTFWLVSSVIYPRNEVFFDDTGSNVEPVFMWCGYLANVHYWVQFAQKWQAVLDEAPSLPFWHQARARKPKEQRTPPFDALDDEQLREKEAKLADLVGWRDPRGGQGCVAIVVRIPKIYHDQHVDGKITLGLGFPKEYRKACNILTLERRHTIAFRHAMAASAMISHQSGLAQSIDFYYGLQEDDPYQDEVAEAYKVFKFRGPPKYLGTIGHLAFVSQEKRAGIPIQAADMLAWHLGKRSRRKVELEGDDPMWKYIERKPINEIRMTARELIEWVNEWNDPKLAEAIAREFPVWKATRAGQTGAPPAAPGERPT